MTVIHRPLRGARARATWTNVTTTPHEPVNPSNEACPPQANAKAKDIITFPATCARYVRLTGTKRTVDDRYWAIGEMTNSAGICGFSALGALGRVGRC